MITLMMFVFAVCFLIGVVVMVLGGPPAWVGAGVIGLLMGTLVLSGGGIPGGVGLILLGGVVLIAGGATPHIVLLFMLGLPAGCRLIVG